MFGTPPIKRRDSTVSPESSGATPPGRSRVPIPRLEKPSNSRDDDRGGTTSGGPSESKHRVSHACEPCRQRKTKCSGKRPTCKHCQDFKISCSYANGKRDRAKTEMMSLKARVDNYEKLLELLAPQVDSAGRLAITKALQGFRSPDSGSQTSDRAWDGKSLASAEVGFTGLTDHNKEINADTSPYPTGHMGKSSEVAWIQRMVQQLPEDAGKEVPPGTTGFSTNSSPREPSYSLLSAEQKRCDEAVLDGEYRFHTPTYHLDDLSTSIDVDQIDPYLLPDKKVADQLIEAYFATVHISFPIVSKNVLVEQYETFFKTFFPPGSSGRWLAMLNLQFAIGAVYAKLINAEWNGEESEHLKYFRRARLLYLDEGCILENADVQQVQIIGLAGIYLLASNQISRAWHVNGLAIRYAQTLGLNLRNNVQEFDEVEKELRTRIWYALYSLEHLICFMTGRPASIQDKDCSAPMPRPVDEDTFGPDSFDAALQQYSKRNSVASSNSTPNSATRVDLTSSPGDSNPRTPAAAADTKRFSPSVPPCPPFPRSPGSGSGFRFGSHYFLEHTKLNRITAAVLSDLYHPDTINRTWSDVQSTIAALELRVNQWRADLPMVLDFGKRHWDKTFVRERMALAFQYYNAQILVNRPCLCRMDYRIPNESNRSRGFNRAAAATCIKGARETVALLPDEPNPVGLISIAPWWCLLHYLVSASAILMVEISMRAEHDPQQAEGLLVDAKKVLRWLRAMSADSLAAMRSWMVLSKLLIVVAPKIGGDTSDVERDLSAADLSSEQGLNARGGKSNHDAATHIFAHLGTSSVEHMDDSQNPHHRFINDPLPFGNIVTHSPFYNTMASAPAAVHNPFNSTATVHAQFRTPSAELSFRPTVQNFAISDEDGQSPPDEELALIEESGRSTKRTQKRLSRGVSNITMPPPMTFEWLTNTPEELRTSHISSGAGRGRAGLKATAAAVSLSPLDTQSRKRGGTGAGFD